MNRIIYLGNANPFRLEEKAVSFSVWISRQSFKVTPTVFGLGGSGTRWCVRYNYRKDENLTLLFRRFAYFSLWNAKMPSHILLFENFRSLETCILLQFTGGTWRTHTHIHFDQMGETFQFHRCFRGTWCFRYMFAKMKYLFHLSLKRLIFVAQEMGKFRKCLSTFQIMGRMNNGLLFLLFESCRSLKLTANPWQRVQIEE